MALGEQVRKYNEQVVYDKFKQSINFPEVKLDDGRKRYQTVATLNEANLDPIFKEKLQQLRDKKDEY